MQVLRARRRQRESRTLPWAPQGRSRAGKGSSNYPPPPAWGHAWHLCLLPSFLLTLLQMLCLGVLLLSLPLLFCLCSSCILCSTQKYLGVKCAWSFLGFREKMTLLKCDEKGRFFSDNGNGWALLLKPLGYHHVHCKHHQAHFCANCCSVLKNLHNNVFQGYLSRQIFFKQETTFFFSQF